MKPLLVVIASLLVASTARADGLPIPVESNPNSIGGFKVGYRDGSTTVRNGREVATFNGRFVVPVVARDGKPSGLSGDERTLVLINPRKGLRPRKRTSFAELSTEPLRLRRTVDLRGDFSFDALSPDGRSLFLINYISAKDFSQYRVRVYDLQRGRLAAKPIVDPREAPDEMNGYPLARVVSPGGRWHYTLYEGMEHPFIHALDSRDHRAVCIDLELGHGIDPYSLSLEVSPDGGALFVNGGARTLAEVDTLSFDVRPPRVSAPVEAVDTDDSGRWWLAAGVGGMAAWLVLVGWLLRRSRSRRRDQALEGLRAGATGRAR